MRCSANPRHKNPSKQHGGQRQINSKGLGPMTSGAKLKSVWSAAVLLLAFWSAMLLASPPAVGQAPEPARPAQPSPHRHRRVSIDDQVKGLAKSLDLTETQQSAVKRILEQRQQETLRIMRNSSESDKFGRFQMLQVRTVEQIRAVLNDEQKKKYHPLDQRPPQTSAKPSVEDWMKATHPH
jgi:Spy/CpxP family protein refolding chaperone